MDVWAFGCMLSFKGHLLPFTCRKLGLFLDNQLCLHHPNGVPARAGGGGGWVGGKLKSDIVSKDSC